PRKPTPQVVRETAAYTEVLRKSLAHPKARMANKTAARHSIRADRIPSHGMLVSEEELACDQRRTVHRAGRFCAGKGLLEENDFGEHYILCAGCKRQFLPYVTGVVAKDYAQLGFQIKCFRGEPSDTLFAADSTCQSRRIWLGFERLNLWRFQ